MNSTVHFEVTTVNGGWSWRCMRDGCGVTRNGLSYQMFASSMQAHVADRHSTFHFGQLRTT